MVRSSVGGQGDGKVEEELLELKVLVASGQLEVLYQRTVALDLKKRRREETRRVRMSARSAESAGSTDSLSG